MAVMFFILFKNQRVVKLFLVRPRRYLGRRYLGIIPQINTIIHNAKQDGRLQKIIDKYIK